MRSVGNLVGHLKLPPVEGTSDHLPTEDGGKPANRDRRGLVWVLCVTGLLGLTLGIIHARWQDSIENGQVLAGLVEYPKNNPFYIFSVGGWTLTNQVTAALLKAGLSEKGASILLSGAAGLLSFQALATCAFALTRNAWLAICSPLLVVYLVGNGFWGVNYPVAILGSQFTFGMFGLAFILLVLGLWGAGASRVAAFMTPLAVAVHPALGFWLILSLSLAALLDLRLALVELRKAKFFAIAGMLLTLSSWGVFLWLGRHAESGMSTVDYFSAWMRYWELHRQPVRILSGQVAQAVVAAVLAAGWVSYRSKTLPSNARLLLRALVISAALGFLLSFVYRLPPEDVPHALLVVMPSRLMNLISLAALPLIIGLAFHSRSNPYVQILVPFLFILQVSAPLPVYIFVTLAVMTLGVSLSLERDTEKSWATILGAAISLIGLWLLPLSGLNSPRATISEVMSTERGILALTLLGLGLAVFLLARLRILGWRTAGPPKAVPEQEWGWPTAAGGAWLLIAVSALAPVPLALLVGTAGAMLLLALSARGRLSAPAILAVAGGLAAIGGWLAGTQGQAFQVGSFSVSRLAAGIGSLSLGGLILLALPAQRARPVASRQFSMFFQRWHSRPAAVPSSILALGLAVLTLLAFRTELAWSSGDNILGKPIRTGVLTVTADRAGLLVTCSNLDRVQLHTRRAVLLHGDVIDGIGAATPGAAAETARLLKAIYGVDLLHPPLDLIHQGNLIQTTGKDLFEGRTPEEWQAIRMQYGATDVLCYTGWELSLPEVARDTQYTLYEIPRQGLAK